MTKGEILEALIQLRNCFDVDGDMIDFAYSAADLIDRILQADMEEGAVSR